MCKQPVSKKLWYLEYVSEQFITQEMCTDSVKRNACMFIYVPEQLKNREMSEFVVKKYAWLFQFVPDCFISAEMLEKFQDDGWLEAYKHRKAQKAKIKEEVLPVAYHPDCVIDWCFDQEEKKALEKL